MNRRWLVRGVVTIAVFGVSYFAFAALASATEGTPVPQTEPIAVATSVPVPPVSVENPTTTSSTATTVATTTEEPRTVAVDAAQLHALEVAPAADAASAARAQAPLAYRFIDPCIGTCPNIDPATIHPLNDPQPPIEVHSEDGRFAPARYAALCGRQPDPAVVQLIVYTGLPAHVTVSYWADVRYGDPYGHVDVDTTPNATPGVLAANFGCVVLPQLPSHPRRVAVHIVAASDEGGMGEASDALDVPAVSRIPPAYTYPGEQDDELWVVGQVEKEGQRNDGLATYIYPELLPVAASRDPAGQCADVASLASTHFQDMRQTNVALDATAGRASGVELQHLAYVDDESLTRYYATFNVRQEMMFKVETSGDYTLCLWWVARQANGAVTVTKQQVESVHQARRFRARLDIASVDISTTAPSRDVNIRIGGVCGVDLRGLTTGHHDVADTTLCDFGAHPYDPNLLVSTQLDGDPAVGGALVQLPYRPCAGCAGGTFLERVPLPDEHHRRTGTVTVRVTLVAPPTASNPEWNASSAMDVDADWRPVSPLFTGYTWELGNRVGSSTLHVQDATAIVGFDRSVVADAVVAHGHCIGESGSPTDVQADPFFQPDPQHVAVTMQHLCPLEEVSIEYSVTDADGNRSVDSVYLGQPIPAVDERVTATLVCARCGPSGLIQLGADPRVATAVLGPGTVELTVERYVGEPAHAALGAQQYLSFELDLLIRAHGVGQDRVLVTIEQLESGMVLTDPGDPSLYTLTLQATPL